MDWEIRKSGVSCVRCGADLSALPQFRSALFEEPAQLLRHDYCEACWPEVGGDPHSHWRTRAATPRPRPRPRLAWEPAEVRDLLRDLLRGEDPALAYVFSLVVLRRKLARLERVERHASEESLVLEMKGDDARLEVPVIPPAAGEESAVSGRLQELIRRFEPLDAPDAANPSEALP